MEGFLHQPAAQQIARNRRSTIGLFISYFDVAYTNTLWQGVASAAAAQDVNLITFGGSTLNPPRGLERNANVLYQFVDPELLDALIIPANVLNAYSDRETITEFLSLYTHLPLVTLGAFDDAPSIVVDHKAGMEELMTHLIEEHGYRRIALIRGPENNEDAQARYHTYKRVLRRHDIPVDPALITPPGGWEATTAIDGVRLLLDQRNQMPDAIAAINDNLATYAARTLQERGLQVPYDIAIVGFDDVEQAGIFTPPLTTVRQHVFQQGQRACETALQISRGEEVPNNIPVPSRLVVRQSCGCFPEIVTRAGESGVSREKADTSTQQWADVPREMADSIDWLSHEEAQEWSSRLVDAFRSALEERSPVLFLSALDRTLTHVLQTTGFVGGCNNALSAMRQHTLPLLHEEEVPYAESLWQQARVMISTFAKRQPGLYKLKLKRHQVELRRVNQALLTARSVDELMSILIDQFRHRSDLPIPSCYLALYENPESPLDGARLRIAYDESHEHDIAPEGVLFSTRSLLPDGFWPQHRRFSMVVKALYREKQLGVCVMESGTTEGIVYETFSSYLSSALQEVLLFEEQKKAQEELVRSNRELEQFAYIASHDLQEPLRMVSSYLQLLERRYADRLDQDAKDFIDFAVDGARRMRQLINDLLTYSRVGTRAKQFAPTDCNEIVTQTVNNLTVAIQETDAHITCDDLPTVVADETQILQLFQNLMGNAIKFHGDRPPRIHIGVEERDGVWVFSVQDNGIGIRPRDSERIFRIFQRLHGREEYEGTGIGLAVCKKIVERHGGWIWVESEPGQGSTFTFTLPTRGDLL